MTTTTTTNPVICSRCGAECSKQDGWTTGYATLPGGDKVCFDCAAQHEQEYMIKEGKTILYLTHNSSGEWQVSNWSGRLAFPVIWWENSEHSCFGGYTQRTDAWFIGPDGAIWHAKNIGDMDAARCRRTRKKVMWGYPRSGGPGAMGSGWYTKYTSTYQEGK